MLIIKIGKGGKVTMTPSGAPGGECRRLTAHYARHMAGNVASDVTTAEACEPEREKNAEESSLEAQS